MDNLYLFSENQPPAMTFVIRWGADLLVDQAYSLGGGGFVDILLFGNSAIAHIVCIYLYVFF